MLCTYVSVKHNIYIDTEHSETPLISTSIQKHHRDWWGINKQDQTFSVLYSILLSAFWQLLGEGG